MRRWPLLLVLAALIGGCGSDEPAGPGAGTTGPATTQQEDDYYRG
jgi:hypothetical protein